MTLATDRSIQRKPLSFDEFLTRYGDDNRYELSEYWIVDCAGLGGTKHIGRPKQPTLSVCTLSNGEYEIQQFRGEQPIASMAFPELKLRAEQVLKIRIVETLNPEVSRRALDREKF